MILRESQKGSKKDMLVDLYEGPLILGLMTMKQRCLQTSARKLRTEKTCHSLDREPVCKNYERPMDSVQDLARPGKNTVLPVPSPKEKMEVSKRSTDLR